MSDLLPGGDGVVRCAWAGTDAEYQRYHDEEWGTELRGDRPLFEKMSLEGFQAGLSWITILRKRPRFREVFSGFDPHVVAAFGPDDVDRLLQDAGIIRHRGKIQAVIANAGLVADMAEGELDALLWSFAPGTHTPPAAAAEVPAVTPQSTAMSAELRRRGFRFVGPTTMYALMQSSGMVDDHISGCWRAAA